MTTEIKNWKSGRTLVGWCCIGLIVFAVAAAYFIYRTPGEDGAGLSGWLPWLFVALCPLMHLFMHKRHGGHSRDKDE